MEVTLRARSVRLALVLLVAALAGCSYLPAGRSLFGERRSSVVRVRVVNRNASDAVLHALHDRRRIPLGTAAANATTSYAIDWRRGGLRPLRIELELVAERRPCVTDLMMVEAGDELELEIEAHVRYLRWCAR